MNLSAVARTTAILAVAFAFAASCALRPREEPLTVGAKNSTEQNILGEILAQHLERTLGAGRVARRFGLVSTQLAHEFLLAGEVDLYPEYTGVALVAIHQMTPSTDRQAVRDVVAETYRTRSRCEWFGPLGFDSTPAIVISRKRADESKYALETLTDAEDDPDGWVLGVSSDYQNRADGLPLLMRNYRLTLRAPLRVLDVAQLYGLLDKGQISMLAGSSTDAALASGEYSVLIDEKRAFPPYEAGVVVRSEVLERNPQLAQLLNQLKGKISAGAMREMNRQVEVEQKPVAQVAAEFLGNARL
jgi:glycine betaine/choline ABC-type transport system substrate-binding protein